MKKPSEYLEDMPLGGEDAPESKPEYDSLDKLAELLKVDKKQFRKLMVTAIMDCMD